MEENDAFLYTLPATAKITPHPFKISVPKANLDDLEALIRLSKIAPHTYESSQTDARYGVTTDWLVAMKDQWLRSYKWRKSQDHFNSFPQWMTGVEGLEIHFVGLFSEKKDAVPILLIHGWPGSFIEFLPLLEQFRQEYTPAALPYHLIVPSLPGFTFSSGPPLDRDFTTEDVARIFDQLMKGLGFESGYVAQGGDIGSHIARSLAVDYDSCKAVHLNVTFMGPPTGVTDDQLTAAEKKGIERMKNFRALGCGYMNEHATRPSTIGHVVASSPLALLAWVGEKFLEWVDEPLDPEQILESITLYWLTNTFPRSIYFYRQIAIPPPVPLPNTQRWYIHKPFGYSHFPKELAPLPRCWVETTGNLVFWRHNHKGGHFAALEQPAALKTSFARQPPRATTGDDDEPMADAEASAPGSLPPNRRGQKEPIAHFLARLPPSTTNQETAGPWIWMHRYPQTIEPGDEPTFTRRGVELLHAYEDTSAELRAAHDKSGAKTTAPLTRKLNPLRQKLEKDIFALARETRVLAGKWMLFPSPRDVDGVWKTVVEAMEQGKLSQDGESCDGRWVG
ncbi:Isopenicillin N synthase [Penicillium chermesinum]|nr:Isopenicillin N synthase [Penicillium chermesinum]